MKLLEINKKYTELATSGCCLSDGAAVNYAQVQSGEVCVDLGSGIGTNTIRLSEKVGMNGFVFGIENEYRMVEKAIKIADKLGVTNVNFITSPPEKIAVGDEVADLVISNCTFIQVSEKQVAWNEIFRILKKGGRFVISDIYLHSLFTDVYQNNSEAISECWAGSVTRDEYLKQLETAGFSTIAILEESAPYLKGNVMVVSWTIAGNKPLGECSWCN